MKESHEYHEKWGSSLRRPCEATGFFITHGVLHNKNTIEDFRNCDKIALMKDEGRKIWDSIIDGSCLENPSLFARFFVLSFAVRNSVTLLRNQYVDFLSLLQDIKKYKFYYYLAYPSINQTVATITDLNANTNATAHFSDEIVKEITAVYRKIPGQIQKTFFILERNADGYSSKPLTYYIKHNDKENNFKDVDLKSIFFGCSDSTSSSTGTWPLRLFLVALVHLW